MLPLKRLQGSSERTRWLCALLPSVVDEDHFLTNTDLLTLRLTIHLYSHKTERNLLFLGAEMKQQHFLNRSRLGTPFGSVCSADESAVCFVAVSGLA